MLHEEELNSPRMKEVLRKIKALKAKADDAGATEAESLAFASKVAEMLATYNLEEAQLDFKDQEIGSIGHEDYKNGDSNWDSSPAKRVLAITVCTLYNVKPLIRRGKDMAWTLIGRKANIIMAKDMMVYLVETTVRLGNQWGRQTGGNRIDFRRGCFMRLSERLADLHREQLRAEQPKWTPTGNPGNLPALYQNEEKLMDQYMRERWNPKPMRAQRVKQGWGAMAGRAAGDTISLNKQMSGGGNLRIEKK